MERTKIGDSVTVNGRVYRCVETFRALGTSWVRYVPKEYYHLARSKDEEVYVESRYATQQEWNDIFCGIIA